MEDIGPTVDLLFISKYKRQLLEMVEEMKELRDAHSKKTEECQRLRSEVNALQEKLWTKDPDVNNTLKDDASSDSLILVEKLQLQTKEIDELRNLKQKMKSLVEHTQSKLREAESKNYELEMEIQKCRATTENKGGSKDGFPHDLAQKYIEMHNTLNQKLENLKTSLEAVKAERQNVLKQQLQMRTQLELLNVLLTEHNTRSAKRERERKELCDQIDVLSAKLDEATQDTLILKQLRKEDEEEFERLSERLAQAVDDRAALLGRLEAVEEETRALHDLMNTEGHRKMLDILKRRVNATEDRHADTAQENTDPQQSPGPVSSSRLGAHDKASQKNCATVSLRDRSASPSKLQLESVSCQGNTATLTDKNAVGDTKTDSATSVCSRCFPESRMSVTLARTPPQDLPESDAGKKADSDGSGLTAISPSSIASSSQKDERAQPAVTGGHDKTADTLFLTSTLKRGDKRRHTGSSDGGHAGVGTVACTLAQGKATDLSSIESLTMNEQSGKKERQLVPLNESDDLTWQSLRRSPSTQIREISSPAGRGRRPASLATSARVTDKQSGNGETTEQLFVLHKSADDSGATQECSTLANSSKSQKTDCLQIRNIVHGMNDTKRDEGSAPAGMSLSQAYPGQTRSPLTSTQKTVSFDCDTLLRAIPL